MTVLLNAEEMREIERFAIEIGSVTGLELMERAGRGAVEAIFAEWPALGRGRNARREAIVLCGPGNNGGDGFLVACLLSERGWSVRVFQDDPGQMHPDAQTMRDRWRDIGDVEPVDDLMDAIVGRLIDGYGPVGYGLFVDAGFGIGLSRPVPDSFRAAFTYLNTHRRGRMRPGGLLGRNGVDASGMLISPDGTTSDGRPEGERFETLGPIVALDIPSGISADTGRIVGADADHALQADLTLSFGELKRGQYLADGLSYCGAVRRVDIGLGFSIYMPSPSRGNNIVRPHYGIRLIRAPERTEIEKPGGHKFHHGAAMVLSGGVGRGGAARMAARAALRIGAGLVTVGCPPAALIENATQLNAVMLRSLRDSAALTEALKDDRVTALCLGPGLGTGARETALVDAALVSGRATVLDADALTLVAGDDALFRKLHGSCVLTPHDGEFARLFPDLAVRLKDEPTTYSRIHAAKAAAVRCGAIVVLKGPDTVVSDFEGTSLHAASGARAVPWLATAGAGDVLAGLITGLLARGFTPRAAAEAAVWLHVECARQIGPGLIAEDLPDAVPSVIASL